MVSSATGWTSRVFATFACLLLVLAGTQTASAADATTPADSSSTTSSTSSSEPGATLESAPVVSQDGAATASQALIDFVNAVLESTGFAAPDLLSCVCTVAVSVGVGGDAHAVAVGGTAGGTDAALRSGDSGPAMAVSVSADGPAAAEAASGNTGQTSGGDTPGRASTVIAPRGVTSAGRALVPQQKLDDAVRGLVNALLLAARERSTSDLGEYDDDLAAEVDAGLAEASTATVSIDLEVWSPTNGLSRDGGGCTPDADGVTVICAIALAISLGGTADAEAHPPVGAAGTGTVDGPGVVPAPGAGWPGDAIAIALSMNAAAAASADAGDAWIAAAYDPAVPVDVTGSTGTTGSAVSAALTASGSAGSQARSGDSGAIAAQARERADAARDAARGGTGGVATASGSSGDTGDSLALALGRAGADSAAASGDSGDVTVSAQLGDAGAVDNRVDGYDASALSPGTGGSADARGATGTTGWSHAMTLGQTSSAQAGSGGSGDVDAQARGGAGGNVLVLSNDAAAIPTTGGTGGSALITGTTGGTGASLALALADGRAADGRAHSGESGNVAIAATGGLGGCAALRSDASPDPCAAPAPPVLPAGPAEPTEPGVIATTPATPDVTVVASPLDSDDAVTVVARSASSRSLTINAPAPEVVSPSSSSSDGSADPIGAPAHVESAPVAYRTGAEPQGKDSPDVETPRGAPANPAGVVLALITSLAIVLATMAMLIKYVKIKAARRRPRRS